MSLDKIFSRITLHRFGILVFALILIGYGVFEAYDLWIGPSIVILEPQDGSRVSENLVTVVGQTRNVSWLSMLGRPIFIDEQGRFSEKLLLPAGYSILTFEAKDRLGRKISETLSLVRSPYESTSTPKEILLNTADAEASSTEAETNEEIINTP